jgi:hypothetical protein
VTRLPEFDLERPAGGRLPRNLQLFCRGLRSAGLPIGPGQTVDALRAVARTGIARRDDLHTALRSVLVSHPGQFELFERVFDAFFSASSPLLCVSWPPSEAALDASASAPTPAAANAVADGSEQETLSPASGGGASRRELLRSRDFGQMSPDEQAEAWQLLRETRYPVRALETRRFAPHAHGSRYDMRRTLKGMLKNGGDLIEFARRHRRPRLPDLVLLCDVSGSMSLYSRAFLLFAHTLAIRQHNVQAFAFGTRLTNIGRRLRIADPDRALARIAADVRDWDGGTRIAACLGRFNRDWGRRVLARNATVVLATDGLERDPEAELEFEMQRLRRSCRQLLWLNPMLRYDGFEPRAEGIRRMLPHVDRFLPAHNVNSLIALCGLLSETGRRESRARGPRARAEAA